jgi:crotonobetainyl-CoA:carnitine CoA-transferase CaiB-like acyl-CoA transferase
MGAFFLVSIGVTTALIARENTGEGQHVETSLFQGALLYTTQIWQHLEKTTAATHELMGKTYPPGVHQPMIFECANREWLHVSVMSGLPPLKSMDEILQLEDAPDSMTFLTLPPEERAKFTEARGEKFKQWDRDELVAAFLANNHAAEAIIPMAEAFAHPQVIANDMVATVVDPDLGPTTQMGVPIHLLGTPGAIRGPQPRPGEHNAEILGELGYATSEVDRLAAAGVISEG